MPKITTQAELVAAIEAVLDYNWADEEADYQDHEGDGEAHIFTTLQALRDWIN